MVEEEDARSDERVEEADDERDAEEWAGEGGVTGWDMGEMAGDIEVWEDGP